MDQRVVRQPPGGLATLMPISLLIPDQYTINMFCLQNKFPKYGHYFMRFGMFQTIQKKSAPYGTLSSVFMKKAAGKTTFFEGAQQHGTQRQQHDQFAQRNV